nr:unnamed protein product [Digitaria exilis]
MLAGRPELFLDPTLPSLSARLAITANAVPELAAAAAAKAITEWGRPAGDITHLVVSTNSGADVRLAELLGLRPTVQRTMLSLHVCFGGYSALRLAMDIAGSNRGARVLVAVAEATTVLSFRPPVETHPDALVAAALFGDGAGAVIAGAGDDDPTGTTMEERHIFYMVSASQATLTLPGTEDTLSMRLQEDGYDIGISVKAPAIVRDNIEGCVANMLAPLGLAGGGWNGLFWAVHPGGRAILDSCQAAFGLEPGKLAASRHVLSEYGNMYGATIIFVLDEIRRRRHQDGERKERDDCELGVMLGIGPGVTIEMMVLLAAGSSVDGS